MTVRVAKAAEHQIKCSECGCTLRFEFKDIYESRDNDGDLFRSIH